ncbi:bi-domain-containing oxidoreductase [Tahibacter amnicola]|uniref:Bi-domain-containing oxidoreductase n=1 Tax=Tahibacter amnicola TaxID=2976241 RepID=A0ABY6B8H8_9GAMM|nr:bi-domain-containing oxidoreductase [Tahibacter amnicola]UXI66383.1 bi-domain-containing oxidoreductase [Tahibacter amnicola]
MKQVLQHLGNGRTDVADVPAPIASTGRVLVQSHCSLISAGTERMLVEFGRGGWLGKLRQQPDKVRQVLGKLRTDGLWATIEAVRSKLDQPVALGYCNVGRVVSVGSDVSGIAAGDRIVSNGPHAEVVAVPAMLCARIPDAVDDETAAFTVVGAIALNGIRLADVVLGEAVAVTGLGLIGLLAVQILRANGCRVLGIDVNPQRVALARSMGVEAVQAGADDVVVAAERFSRGRGMDAVLITASTASNEPVLHAAQMCRKRGRIVLVGVAGLALSRDLFYSKELRFQVACSYGPGRYDPNYEERGQDYPLAYVRFTQQRNFEAVLDLMAAGQLDVRPLVSHRFAVADAPAAYEQLAGRNDVLGLLLTYPTPAANDMAALRRTVRLAPSARIDRPTVGVIGAGNYVGRVLLPAFARTGVRFHGIASRNGVSAAHYGRRYGFSVATTDAEGLMADPAIDAVIIGTPHDSHADLVCKALSYGKKVFVEKPLCLTVEELARIEATLAGVASPWLMVGFNRRFAPLLVQLRQALAAISAPKSVVVTINAGMLPADHWTQDPQRGGGRLLGEACHFVDLLRFLCGAPIVDLSVIAVRPAAAQSRADNASITLSLADGSIGTIHYLSSGHHRFPKERIEVFTGGRVYQLDNFRQLRAWGDTAGLRGFGWRQDKGQRACAAAVVAALRQGEAAPIPQDEVLEVARWCLRLAEPSS